MEKTTEIKAKEKNKKTTMYQSYFLVQVFKTTNNKKLILESAKYNEIKNWLETHKETEQGNFYEIYSTTRIKNKFEIIAKDKNDLE